MATTFSLFYLGTGPEIDTFEGGHYSENHDALNGLSYGGESDPLALNVQTLSPDSVQGPGVDGDWGSYNADNFYANERFQIDGGTPQTFDALMTYTDTVVTYTDGTTATVEAIVMQDTDGRLYLVPPASGPTAYSDALEAKPIEAITLGTALPASGNEVYNMFSDRYQLTFKDGVIEGTSGDDFIDANYADDPEGDRVDNGDNLAGNNDDVIDAGAGNDTIYYGEGNNTVYGGDGNDLIDDVSGAQLMGDDYLDGGAGADTIYGGGGADTILGGDGHDQLFGEDGDDVIFGGEGDDTISGGNGNDLVLGGDGMDTFVLQDAHGSDTIEGGEGGVDWDVIDASAITGDSTLTFIGDEAGSIVTGTDSAAFTEIEEVQLGSGNDTVDASATAGGVVIDAGDGDDLIIGGAGDDLLTGGAGNDVFAFSDEHGNNIVTDFDMGDADSDGFTNDQLDVSDLTDAEGNPVKTHDVTVSDDGAGNAVLTFPDSTTLTLHGVDPSSLDAGTLYSMGVPCFVVGTRIATPGGPRKVESLLPGDLVSTFDGGAQPVVWAARSDLDPETLAQQPGLRPVRIRAGALGNARDLLVSPQHRVALGASERLEGFVPARWLAENGDGRFRVAKGKRAVSYVHLMLARHAVMLAEGAPVESFYPGPQALAALDVFARAGLFLRFPALSRVRSRADACARYGPLALPELDRRKMLALIPPPGAASTRTAASGQPVRSAAGA